jgi:hypothetical protein
VLPTELVVRGSCGCVEDSESHGPLVSTNSQTVVG